MSANGKRPPIRTAVSVENIPAELRALRIWTLWRPVWKPDPKLPSGGKWDKVPCDADGRNWSPQTNPADRMTFDDAMRAYKRHKGRLGLGVALGDGLAAIDLDAALNARGEIFEWAELIVNRFWTYNETSPSGTGIRILMFGRKPEGAGCKVNGYPNGGAVEIYDSARFVTITGDVCGARGVEDQAAELAKLCNELWPPKAKAKARPEAKASSRPGVGFPGTDAELLDAARDAGNGAKFWALYNGDTSCHGGDDSAADLSLCDMLAFWSGPDEARIDRLFRGSGLFRDKWDSRRGATTYGAMTIAKALDGRTEFYESAGNAGRAGKARESKSTAGAPPSGDASEPDPAQFLQDDWPAPPDPAVYRGVIGQIVELLRPSTESDPVGLLVQLLVGFGNILGRGPHLRVEDTPHYPNEFAVCVGDTSTGRKGTSWKRARSALEQIDVNWTYDRVAGGLSSGEGLIHEIRDPTVTPDGETTDPGIADKRLLCVETEFGSTLRILARQGNSLSGILRQAWDSERVLRTMVKHSPTRATEPHVSIVGHVTAPELRSCLAEVEVFNGLGNRFLWVCVRRSQILPRGGRLDERGLSSLKALGRTLWTHAERARKDIGEVQFSAEADQLWEDHYERLTSGRPGLWGIITARGAPHVLRLAMLYALAEGQGTIQYEHLESALALWDYCDRSAAHLFGDRLGDRTADAILDALKAAPEGLTRTDIRNLFGRNKPADEVARALAVLLKYHLARREPVETGGRTAERWTYTGGSR